MAHLSLLTLWEDILPVLWHAVWWTRAHSVLYIEASTASMLLSATVAIGVKTLLAGSQSIPLIWAMSGAKVLYGIVASCFLFETCV
jgi:hypothetical protein